MIPRDLVLSIPLHQRTTNQLLRRRLFSFQAPTIRMQRRFACDEPLPRREGPTTMQRVRLDLQIMKVGERVRKQNFDVSVGQFFPPATWDDDFSLRYEENGNARDGATD